MDMSPAERSSRTLLSENLITLTIFAAVYKDYFFRTFNQTVL